MGDQKLSRYPAGQLAWCCPNGFRGEPAELSARSRDAAVHGGHLRTFGVAHYNAHQESSGLHIEGRFDADARAAQSVERGVPQSHLDDFLNTGYEISVFVEDGRRYGQFVVAAVATRTNLSPLVVM